MKNEIHAVIFDMDGLLIDTEKHLVRCWCQAAQEFGYPMERRHALAIRSLAGQFAASYLRNELGEDFDYWKVRERRKELVTKALSEYGLERKKGTLELLRWLKENGFRTAVATATDEIRAEAYLREIGAWELLDEVVCATMVKNGKPCPDVYLYACEQIGEAPENCIALEDSPNGVLSAYRAGCQVIMVPDLTPPENELKLMLSGIAESLIDVIDLIKDRI